MPSERDKSRWWWWLLLAVTWILLLVVSYISLWERHQRQQELDELRLQIDVLKAQLKTSEAIALERARLNHTIQKPRDQYQKLLNEIEDRRAHAAENKAAAVESP